MVGVVEGLSKDIICWWSGGITSAYACNLAIGAFGVDRCRVIMIDTKNEHGDTYRFKADCEKWYGVGIEVITSDRFNSIQEVWRKYKALNHATGAVCSSMLKRSVRESFEKSNKYTHQVFGFEYTKKEINRFNGLLSNHPHTNPIAPLIDNKIDKMVALRSVEAMGIRIPEAYRLGYNNNNCLKTGCVQGGVGYWKKLQKENIQVFESMAAMEHELTAARGAPVTVLRDQSRTAKESGDVLVFLRKHPEYPNLKCLDDMKGLPVCPLNDCNGFCGTNDLNPVGTTEHEINNDESVIIWK